MIGITPAAFTFKWNDIGAPHRTAYCQQLSLQSSQVFFLYLELMQRVAIVTNKRKTISTNNITKPPPCILEKFRKQTHWAIEQ